MNILHYFLMALSLFISFISQAQLPIRDEKLNNPDNEPAPVHPVPHPRQLKWQQMEYYAFFHYGMNTYTGNEWGYGDEDPEIFAPLAQPDVRQWLQVALKSGMRGGIAVAKHHDGFCLWPTGTTEHNVTHSGNEHGCNTNIPRDFAEAARILDMEYGFYVSPWDRNSIHRLCPNCEVIDNHLKDDANSSAKILAIQRSRFGINPSQGSPGVIIYSLVIVPDCESPHDYTEDKACYIDNIVY